MLRDSKLNRLLKPLVLVFAVAMMSQTAWAAPQPPLTPDELDALVEQAQTPEDHLKLAEHYKAEAARLEKSAERHAAMGERYRTRKNLPPKVATVWRNMATHCSDIAKSLRNAAKLSADMAASHEKMAKEQ